MAAAEAGIPEWIERLRDWQQGDFALELTQVLVVDSVDNDGNLLPSAGDAIGLAVISQTCDIVNWGAGREWIVVAPLIEATEITFLNAQRGTTPAMAVLENPPSANVVVDLTQAMTIHKSLLAGLSRVSGFQSDPGRTRFADAISRKYGRFAFPDAFAENVLGAIRTRMHKTHGKDSDRGRTFAGCDSIRVAASPS